MSKQHNGRIAQVELFNAFAEEARLLNVEVAREEVSCLYLDLEKM